MQRPGVGRGWAVLWARRGLALSVAAVVLVLGVSAAALVPERWTARVRLVVRGGGDEVARGTRGRAEWLATHAELLASQRVALAAVEALWRMNAAPPGTAWTALNPGVRTRQAEAARVLERIRVETRPESAVLTLVWSGDEPVGAARMANALARSYVELLTEWPDERDRRAGLGQGPEGAADLGPGGWSAVILDPAQPPLRADPGLRAWLVLGSLGLAALGGWLAVWLAERWRPRVRTRADLQSLLGQAAGLALLHRIVPPGLAAGRSARRDPSGGLAEGPATLPSSRAVPPAASEPLGGAPAGPLPAAQGLTATVAEGPVAVLSAPRVQPSVTPAARRPLGELLMDAGVLPPPEVARTLAWARQHGLRFGEAALARRVLSERQLQRVLAQQFGMPGLEAGCSAVGPEVFLAYDTTQRAAADLRCLRARLERLPQRAGQGVCVAFVGPGRGVGRTVLAANLAVAEAQAGRRVVLIDGDLRAGRLHRIFGLAGRGGLSSMLNQCLAGSVLQRVPGLGALTVLGAGPRAPNPAELLTRDTWQALLGSLRRGFDRVIVDTGPLDRDADAGLIVRSVGTAVLVVRRDRTELAALHDSYRDLLAQPVHLAAVVLNAPPTPPW